MVSVQASLYQFAITFRINAELAGEYMNSSLLLSEVAQPIALFLISITTVSPHPASTVSMQTPIVQIE